MRAAEFDPLFVSLVAEPLAEVGFEPWGKSLWFEDNGIRAALLRTEMRWMWPFQLTLVVGHDCLRDFDDRMPAPRSRNVNEWPVKWQPSDALELATEGWEYVPLGPYPQEKMIDESVEVQLHNIAAAVATAAPKFGEFVGPLQVLARLKKLPSLAWCEVRWIEDYGRWVTRPGESAG